MKINQKKLCTFLLTFAFLSIIPPSVFAQTGEGNDIRAPSPQQEDRVRIERDQIPQRFPSRELEPDREQEQRRVQAITIVTFTGDVPADNDKRVIIEGLRNAVRTMCSERLYVTEYAPAWRNKFTFTINTNRLSPYELRSEVTVAFYQDDRVLCETETYIITTSYEYMIARRIVERIRGDKEFFDKINELIE